MEGGQRREAAPWLPREAHRAPVPRVSLAMRWKVVSRNPRAFPEALPLSLGWGEDARVSGKAEKVGRGRKSIASFHRRARFPPAVGEGGKEGTWDGEQPGNHDPLLWLTSQADTFAAVAGISLLGGVYPSRETRPRQRRGREVPGRWGIFNTVVAILGCFYWGLEPQMAVYGGWECSSAFLEVVCVLDCHWLPQ